jgi:plasmid stabilization system protein ParE
VELKFHRLVQTDLNAVLGKYSEISEKLSDSFHQEFMDAVRVAASQPGIFHFDALGLRRCNLTRFPYHFLYDVNENCVRVWVLRHDKQKPTFGLKRFVR